jgi:hypothetical protein
MPIPFEFDFKKPDYTTVFKWRLANLEHIRKHPEVIPGMKCYYKDNPAQFITDWGVTLDPRNVERGLPSLVPFILFPRQEEWVHWFMGQWKGQKPGITDKSREMGVSWLMLATAATLCLFTEGVSAGFGSRKQEYVDKIGDPKSLLQKVRQFVSNVPQEFRGSWDIKKHAPHMRIVFPDTNSIISGEAGDGIGRGDRTSFYFVDEAAWLARPELVEASLSQTTNCRIDVSTPCGMSNPFARKRFSGKISVFEFDWRDDPRKDQAWYDKKVEEIDDEVVIAQEIDRNYLASMEGVLIPAKWVQASIDAHIKLGITPNGVRKLGFDVADQGGDLNAMCGRHGILVEHAEAWSGKGEDIYGSVERVFNFARDENYDSVDYDGDGLGAGVRGDARIINLKRQEGFDETNKHKFPVPQYQPLTFEEFRGSGEVIDPDEQVFKNEDSSVGRTNADFFANRKAQAWWALRKRFQMTYRAVVEGREVDKDMIISLFSYMPHLRKLTVELSQPTFSQNGAGKIIVDKTPDGSRSPNYADAVMIAFAPPKLKRKGFFDV